MIVTQHSRISHHTVTFSASTTGSTFTIPTTEDFTSGTWTPFDLCLSEIGVDELNKKAYIRIGDEIKEITNDSAGGESLAQTMDIGNRVSATYPKFLSPNGTGTTMNLNNIEAGFELPTTSRYETSIVGSGPHSTTYIYAENGLVQIEATNFIVNGRDIFDKTVATTDATPTSVGITFSTSTGSRAVIKAMFMGTKVTGTFPVTDVDVISGEVLCVARNNGTLGIVGQNKTIFSEFTTADAEFAVSGSNLIFQVTGEAATTIQWSVNFEMLRQSGFNF